MVLQRTIQVVNADGSLTLPTFTSTLTVPIALVANTHWSLQFNLLSQGEWSQLVFFMEDATDPEPGDMCGSVGACATGYNPIGSDYILQPIEGASEEEGNPTGVTTAEFEGGTYTITFDYDGVSTYTLNVLDPNSNVVWTNSNSFEYPPGMMAMEPVGFANRGDSVTFSSGEIDWSLSGNLLPITTQGDYQMGTYQGSPLLWSNETGEVGNSYQYIKTYPTVSTFTIASVVVPSGTPPPPDAQIDVFANSIIFNTAAATWGANGAYTGITIPVTNQWSADESLVIYATMKTGTGIYVLEGSVSLAAGQTASVFLLPIGVTIPTGSYTVTFSAVTMTNEAVSAPTTPVTITVS